MWRYGDAGNLDPRRTAPLLTHEWITCLCLREEMEYDVDGDETPEVPFRVRADSSEPEVNRFAQDWITLHLFATLFYLTERHQSAFAFLKNGGMKWAEKVRHLTPETLANSARVNVLSKCAAFSAYILAFLRFSTLRLAVLLETC